MTTAAQARSMLVIAPDPATAEAIGKAVSSLPDLKVDREISTLSGLNGSAVKMAAQHDLVVFEAHPDDSAEIDAIRQLVADQQGETVFIALADDRISFAQLRQLTEAGVDEVLPLPVQGTDLGAALARLGREQGDAGRNQGRLFPVIQARGGIGASTLAVNLADQLSTMRRRRERMGSVALVDLDIQYGTVGSMLDLPDQNALMDLVMRGALPDAKFLELAMKRLPSGLSVLAAPSRLGPIDALSAEQLQALLVQLRAGADYVIADLPHVMVPWLEPVLQQADAILLVTDMTVPAIRHCRRQIDFLTSDHPDLSIRIVVNHDHRPMFRGAAVREAARVLERPLDIWLPHDGRAARAATDRGLPLSKVSRRSPLTRAIGRLARTLSTEFPITAIAHKQV